MKNKKIKHPKTVFIGPYTVAIEALDAADASADGTYGHFNPNNMKIRVNFEGSLQVVANTVLHEVIHAINWSMGTGDDSTEEQFTRQCANGLCEFWLRNPEFCKWWAKMLTRSQKKI